MAFLQHLPPSPTQTSPQQSSLSPHQNTSPCLFLHVTCRVSARPAGAAMVSSVSDVWRSTDVRKLSKAPSSSSSEVHAVPFETGYHCSNGTCFDLQHLLPGAAQPFPQQWLPAPQGKLCPMAFLQHLPPSPTQTSPQQSSLSPHQNTSLCLFLHVTCLRRRVSARPAGAATISSVSDVWRCTVRKLSKALSSPSPQVHAASPARHSTAGPATTTVNKVWKMTNFI